MGKEQAGQPSRIETEIIKSVPCNETALAIIVRYLRTQSLIPCLIITYLKSQLQVSPVVKQFPTQESKSASGSGGGAARQRGKRLAKMRAATAAAAAEEEKERRAAEDKVMASELS